MIHLREEDLEVLSHCLIIGQNSITVSSCCGLPSYFSFVMHSLFWGLANSCERMNYEKEMINFFYPLQQFGIHSKIFRQKQEKNDPAAADVIELTCK